LFLYETRPKWKENCPSIEEAAKRLMAKAEYTSKIVMKVVNPDGTYYFTVNAEGIRALAKQVFGKFQKIDESEPPPSNVYKALIDTVPGLLACMHARYYYERSRLKNEVVSLEGPGGTGKSSYVYWLVKLIGGIMVNDQDSLIQALKVLLEKRKWVPILVLDDIGAILSKYWFLSKAERKWNKVFRLLEYAKDFTGLILMTERSFQGIAKKLRELSTLNGKIVRMVMGDYIVDYIKWGPPGSKAAKYIDVLWPGLTIDERDWANMLEKRREIGLRLLQEFEEGGEE
jgi:hypothetical protein